MDVTRMNREELLVEVQRLRTVCERLLREARPVHETLKAALESEQRHQQALRALQESEARFRALTDAARDAIFCKDRGRCYTFVNPYMLRLLQKTAADVLGRTPEEVYDAETAATIGAVDERCYAGESVSAVRTVNVGGKTVRLHTVQFPLRDGTGAVTGVGGIVRDEEIAAE